MGNKIYLKMAEEVKNGERVVYLHCATKGFEVGAVVGATLLLSRAFFASPNRPLLGVRRLARAGPLLGAAASTALAHYRMQKNPGPVGEVDRAFRIKHNRKKKKK